MVYSIKSKKSLEDLVQLLNEQKIETTLLENKQVKIKVETEKDYDIFISILSSFMAYEYLQDALTKNLKKKSYEKKEIEEITNEELMNLESVNYFKSNIKILVLEYFKNSKSINLDNFYIFNMKGFNEEINVLVDNLMMLDEEEMENFYGEEIGVQDVFEAIKQTAQANGIDLKDFEELHILPNGKNLKYENKKGRVLDQEFFVTELGSALQFEMGNEIENAEALRDVLLCSCLLNIFDVKKVIIHNNILEASKELLVYNLNILKKENGKKFKVLNCIGCSKCE